MIAKAIHRAHHSSESGPLVPQSHAHLRRHLLLEFMHFIHSSQSTPSPSQYAKRDPALVSYYALNKLVLEAVKRLLTDEQKQRPIRCCTCAQAETRAPHASAGIS